MSKENDDKRILKLTADTIRMLAVDGVQKAKSGHPGMPMGAADCAAVLWAKFLQFNPRDPLWMNRDRFILSAGHGSMLLYALLHLFGYKVTLADLQSFRQWGSHTAGHPEYGALPGIETTTGPLGQGFANGVGMAIASKMFSGKFNDDNFSPVSHSVFGIVSDGDLMEGVASEAASLAGHLQLGNLIYIYDDNNITIDGKTEITFTEDVEKRFQAYGWHTLVIDGHDHDAIESALDTGIRTTDRPTLILAKTHIGYGSPNKQDTSGSHGSPLGEDEVKLTKEKMGWPLDPLFHVPAEVRDFCDTKVSDLQEGYQKWQSDFLNWKNGNPEKAELWNTMVERSLPDDFIERIMAQVPTDEAMATRVSGSKVIQAMADSVPGLCGGSADLNASTKSNIASSSDFNHGNYNGRNIPFGIREHGMGAILNGMALYGGLIPYGSTFFVFSDYMRPSIRLSALMKAQVIYVFTHDSIFVGEDGPTHQPVEHLAALRAIPDLTLFRPADTMETIMAWSYAIQNNTGPSVLCLTRQNVPPLDRPDNFSFAQFKKGGYILSDAVNNKPDIILIATGSEVSVAIASQKVLEESGKSVRVVSIPSLDLFNQQDLEYQNSVIGDGVPLAVIEAGVSQGWHELARGPFLFLGLDRFGASAPYQVLAEKFGFTPEAVVQRVNKWLDEIK